MAYLLQRDRDGAGDSGPMLEQYRRGDDGEIETRIPKDADDIELGWVVRVGSPYARTYDSQDYWTTTYVTEILDRGVDGEGDDARPWTRFRTGNSVYMLRG